MRYYQYLKGEQRGKVVTLESIDDTLGDMILYIFSDGFRCSDEFIAPLNTPLKSVGDNILCEVSDENNIWKFKENVIKPQVKQGVGKDGTMYDIVDPYFTDKNGNNLNKEHVEIKLIPPVYSNKKVEDEDPLENYRESLRYLKKENNSEKVEKDIENTKDNIVASAKDYRVITNSLNTKQTLVIDFNNFDKLCVKFCGEKQKEYTTKELSEVLYSILETQMLESACPIAKDEAYIEAHKEINEKSAISSTAKAMLKNCIKHPADINLQLELYLPKPEVFKMIKENYQNGMAREFIAHIINEIDVNDLKDKLTNSLYQTYEVMVNDAFPENIIPNI